MTPESRRYSELVSARRSRVVEGATPEPGRGEVLIEIEACGVCASELHTWTGSSSGFPRRLGHEPSGTVRSVGEGVTKFEPGQAVTGLLSAAYSQLEVANQHDLVLIPEGVPRESVLGEPLACLVNAQRRTRVELADRVAVVGLGFMGLGMLQLLRLRGPRRLVGVDVRKEARKKALELGADEVHHPEKVPGEYLLRRWSEWQGPGGVEVVVEASGTQPGLALAGQMVRAHGILSILGFHQGGPRQVDVEMWNWKAIDVVNAHARRHANLMESMRIGLELVAKGLVGFESLVTHRYGLDRVDRAYADLQAKPAGFIKAVILP